MDIAMDPIGYIFGPLVGLTLNRRIARAETPWIIGVAPPRMLADFVHFSG